MGQSAAESAGNAAAHLRHVSIAPPGHAGAVHEPVLVLISHVPAHAQDVESARWQMCVTRLL